MTARIALGPGAEFDRIRGILDRLGNRAAAAGGDCALIPLDGAHLAMSCDLCVEGRHFRTEWLTLEEIGWRSAAGALSDLAAAGATVIGLLASVGVPAAASSADVARLMDGVGDAVDAVGGKVLGGDLSGSPQWIVDLAVVGRVERPVTRAGARPGDGVWVSGRLGAARAACDALLRGQIPDPGAREAFAHPRPRIVLGQRLAALGATAMIDLSDGLGGDAGHLAAASGCELAIDLAAVPLGPGAEEEARRSGRPAAAYAAMGGEDYELLVTIPPSVPPEAVASAARECGVPLTRIGDAREGRGARLRLEGRDMAIPGFDHFA